MQIISAGNQIQLPDLLIVGAAKAGTTTLYTIMEKHPGIFFSKVKEPYFFSFMEEDPVFPSPEKLDLKVTHLKDYLQLFRSAGPHQILAEGSTIYLYDYKKVIANIQGLYGPMAKKVKIIILLRDPVERLWSHYLHLRKFDKEPLDFSSAINPHTIGNRLSKGWTVYYDYLGFSDYQQSVEAYKSNFEQVLVLDFTSFKKNPQSVADQLSSFLSLPFSISSLSNEKQNVGGIPKNKLLAIVSRLFYGNNPFKKLIGLFIPQGLKYHIQIKFSKYFFKKAPMPAEDRALATAYLQEATAYYRNYFQ